MNFNISSLIHHSAQNLSFSETIEVPSSYNLVDSRVVIHVESIVSKMNDDCYIFEGKLSANMVFNCDKCLEIMDYPLDIEFSEKFADTIDTDVHTATYLEDDFWFFDGETIDLNPALESVLFLNIPVKVVCKDDCQGLCYVCGQNLNIETCNCDTSHYDLRFEGLRSLFKNEEV